LPNLVTLLRLYSNFLFFSRGRGFRAEPGILWRVSLPSTIQPQTTLGDLEQNDTTINYSICTLARASRHGFLLWPVL